MSTEHWLYNELKVQPLFGFHRASTPVVSMPRVCRVSTGLHGKGDFTVHCSFLREPPTASHKATCTQGPYVLARRHREDRGRHRFWINLNAWRASKKVRPSRHAGKPSSLAGRRSTAALCVSFYGHRRNEKERVRECHLESASSAEAPHPTA